MIIFLYGQDSFRSLRLLQELKDKFRRQYDPEGVNLETLAGDDLALDILISKLGTGSLFSQKRMLVITNIFSNKQEKAFTTLLTALEKIIDRSDLIIIFRDQSIEATKLNASAKKLFNFLKKQQYSQEFGALSPAGLNNFIREELAKYEKKISHDALSELILRTDSDPWLLSQVIKKTALASSEPVITKKEVKLYCPEKFNENFFALSDAISLKQKTKAITILEEQFLAGANHTYIIAMLIRQFKILLQIKTIAQENLSKQQIAQKLKLHPYVVTKSIGQCRNFTTEQLKYLYNSLLALDKESKSSAIDIKAELLNLIASL